MQVVTERNWANGLKMTVYDNSRRIAADRWHIKVSVILSLPMTAGSLAGLETGDPELTGMVRTRLGETVDYRLDRERNFVDRELRDGVVAELTDQLLATISVYLAGDDFPVRMLARKYREIMELCAAERARVREIRDEDDEPADFSHCFR